MSPLPADVGPFVAREREARPALATAALVGPFVAGAHSADERDVVPRHAESLPADDAGRASADAAELPWLSESVSALSGLAGFGEELVSAAPESPPPVSEEIGELEVVEQWDDELGTFALSEELPEIADDEGEPGGTVELPPAADEGSWPNYALPIVTAPVPSTAVEGVAQRLERIARMLRERGPTGPLEENGADPLGALITGYVLGMSGAEKNQE